MKKRIVSLLLSAIMVLGLLPMIFVISSSAEVFNADGTMTLTWNENTFIWSSTTVAPGFVGSSTGYYCSDIFTVPQAGTRITFKRTVDGVGEANENGKLDSYKNNVAIISLWDSTGADAKFITDVGGQKMQEAAMFNATEGYVYTTTVDNENLRISMYGIPAEVKYTVTENTVGTLESVKDFNFNRIVETNWTVGYFRNITDVTFLTSGSAANFRTSDIIHLSKAGTTITYIDTKGSSAVSNGAIGVSHWKYNAATTEWEYDDNGKNILLDSLVSIPQYQTINADGSVTYSYTSESDDEYIRVAYWKVNGTGYAGGSLDVDPFIFVNDNSSKSTADKIRDEILCPGTNTFNGTTNKVDNLKWHSGIIGSDTYTVKVKSFYSFAFFNISSLIKVPFAGTTLTFNGGKTAYKYTANIAPFSVWEADIDGVFKPVVATCKSAAVVGIADANGDYIYSYTTAKDNEYVCINQFNAAWVNGVAATEHYDITWSNPNYTADQMNALLALDVTTEEKASVRIGNDLDGSGLRFTTEVNKEAFQNLATVFPDATIKKGTLITPYAYVTEAGSFTKEALNQLTKTSEKYLDITSNGWFNEEETEFAGSIISVMPKHYDVEFAAIGYVEITVGDDTYTLYSDTYSVRSVKEIATAAIADVLDAPSGIYVNLLSNGKYSFYSQAQYDILTTYAN